MQPDTLHAIMQAQTDALKLTGVFLGLITAVITLITATLTASRVAFGFPPKGDWFSTLVFINLVVMILSSIAALVVSAWMGFLSHYAGILDGIWFVTQIVGFFLQKGPPSRLAIFTLAGVIASAAFYVSAVSQARTDSQIVQVLSQMTYGMSRLTDTTEKIVGILDRLTGSDKSTAPSAEHK